MHVVMGDTHGDFRLIRRFIDNCPEWKSLTILGDLGIGYPGQFDVPFKSPIPIRFIRGNHDNPDFIRNLPLEWKKANWHYIPDGTIDQGVLYIGGAWSIDAANSQPGMTWWYNEELNQREQQVILDDLRESTEYIHTVLTHDAPYDLYPTLGIHRSSPSMTNAFFSHLLHRELEGPKKPVRWLFGHHHKSVQTEVLGVKFRCLDMAPTGDITTLTIDI